MILVLWVLAHLIMIFCEFGIKYTKSISFSSFKWAIVYFCTYPESWDISKKYSKNIFSYFPSEAHAMAGRRLAVARSEWSERSVCEALLQFFELKKKSRIRTILKKKSSPSKSTFMSSKRPTTKTKYAPFLKSYTLGVQWQKNIPLDQYVTHKVSSEKKIFPLIPLHISMIWTKIWWLFQTFVAISQKIGDFG